MAHIQKLLKLALITVFSVSISGCGASLLASRDSNPVIEDYTGNWLRRMLTGDAVSTFSTTASRRMVVVNNFDDKIHICSEAPPDVGEAFASAVANSLKLSITEPKTQVTNEALNNYARSIATQITPLVYRTQGLQFYRDAMYSLCIDNMNKLTAQNGDKTSTPNSHSISLPLPFTTVKTITETKKDKTTGELITTVQSETQTKYDTSADRKFNSANYEDMRLFYAIQAVEAIKAELPVMLEAQKTFFQYVKTGEVKLDIDSVKKIIDAINPKAVVNGTNSTPETAKQ